ncbi:MAG: hypothetical protein ACK55Z_02385, partial [bacterium]
MHAHTHGCTGERTTQDGKAVQACPVARREDYEIITSGVQGAGLQTQKRDQKQKIKKEKKKRPALGVLPCRPRLCYLQLAPCR